ncbi:spike base protein, RCAP_Rcc01079 family [Phenylobacterium sp. 58.2.17]|uniref:spike base protein, RCAP_Rcc01079 family n=1 Tax=Phenylobacterium sp. 58.2.17 TaxID=2969306 RepID=UPI002263B579|nr:hypothetical protein [Phenylobacterium sp. 58.2.17]MCX7585022.1 hypothetical protein [Phenylobacterium sp. 58.2.17]
MTINSATDFGILGVGVDLVPIVPDDDNDLPTTARAIRCRPDGVSGALKFISHLGHERTTHIEAGEVLYVAAVRVLETGTAAEGLEAIL